MKLRDIFNEKVHPKSIQGQKRSNILKRNDRLSNQAKSTPEKGSRAASGLAAAFQAQAKAAGFKIPKSLLAAVLMAFTPTKMGDGELQPDTIEKLINQFKNDGKLEKADFTEVSEDGRIVKGVNTTADVGVNQTKIEAAKFGNTVTKDGVPPTLSKQVKGKSTNVLFNLGLSEGYKLKLERDKDIDVLHILDTNTKKRIEVRGKKGYEGNGYDAQDKLHQVLDSIGRAANISELMNGEVVTINPKHPQGPNAIKTANDVLTTEIFKEAMGLAESLTLADSQDKLEEALGELDPSTEIYVDMDGVLADFFGEWARLMGKEDWRDIKDVSPALAKIRATDDFWLKLPVLPQAKQLLALIKQVKGEYNICTSPLADDPNSEPHKRVWIEKNLGFFPPKNVYITHNKPQYATNKNGKPNILIDDYGVNIDKWEAAGGIGFKYKDHKFERTAQELGKLVKEPVDENFADGKKPGRKGLAKRSGINTKASVSSLRKTAKRSSGEKQRMAHWLANMKAGKAKKK